jgi:hypothetical protein
MKCSDAFVQAQAGTITGAFIHILGRSLSAMVAMQVGQIR